jgi:hypothetical protein
VHVVASGGGACGLGPLKDCRYEAYWYSEGKWLPVVPIPVQLAVRPVVSTSDGVFVRGAKGEIVRLDSSKAVVLQAPGPCEAMTRTSKGELLASFTNAGVFVLQDRWVKLFDAPYERSDAEHTVQLAESNGTVALSRSAGRIRKAGSPGPNIDYSYVGNDTLWVSGRNAFEPVDLFR